MLYVRKTQTKESKLEYKLLVENFNFFLKYIM